MRSRLPCVYLLASSMRGTLYLGVTSDLIQRVWQHKHGQVPGFSCRYLTHLLVWHETHDTMDAAILREKRIKSWRRAWKLELIETHNPQWRDLYSAIIGAEARFP
ncbi:GIY-YIG nuclease family protein [Lysobacter silvisoli]|uniref:GIY-YIG nuclease family protein n=1 Tax=Lysobacter silvisoli TaxID=2293254 RepID=A0A371K377_9GAMM|nr:GIY-YIG nuclease family protein [Lysobacter silvisoli]RDZ28385.1 GIY-YIG nuclease family protein [Lysobacter silvisoli]